MVCAYDASFGAGLLETLAQVVSDDRSCILVAYDTDYPEPLRYVRPIPDGFGVSMVLSPQRSAASIAAIHVDFSQVISDGLNDGYLERLRTSIPAARSLPILSLLAREEAGQVIIDYLDAFQLTVEITPVGK